MSATLPPTLWAPGRRAKGSATSSNGEELAGEEVLELRLFADKKVWIEEKIQFLSSLPPVEVTTPEPPARSPVSHKELDAWWTEHDRIEREIQAYDMGDLTKMRNIARERSKQELSPRDTDLIELTLTTLFAVDKLLSLLRQRRKALTRLDYRLKWEEATASAWQFRQRLLADLPTFLAKARWRPTPIGDSTLPRSASSSLAPTSHKTRSSSSTSFASSPSSQDLPTLSASASSSTLRASSTTTNLLSLSLAALTTQSRTLSSSAVPLSASFLDKLIDSSITPLPESFLDEQDRLEDSVKAISEGLHRFAEQLVGQRSAADHLFQGLSIAVTTARTLESDIRTAQAELPSVASDFASRLLSLERDLDDLRADLRNLPRPLHPSAPDQSAHNSELVATLQQRLRDAGEAARAAEAAVARCAADRRAVQSAQAVRTDLLRLSKELSTFRWNIEAIITRPAGLRDGLAVLDASDAGAAFEYEWDGLAERIAVAVEQAESVSKDTARCVVELADRKICSSLRKEVRDAAADVRGLRQSVVELLDAEARRRKEVSAVRAASRTIEDAARRVTVVKQELCEAGEDSKWRESRMAPVEAEDVKVAVSQVRAEVDSLFATRVVPVLASLDDLQLVTLRQNLLERSDTVIDRIRGLDTLASQVDGLRRQSRSIQAFVEEVEVVTTELRGLLHELDAVVAGPADALPGDAEIGPMCDRLEGCAETVKALVDNVATSIFLLAPASPPSSTHGSDDLLQLAEQDDHVRIFVNNTCARLRALVDEAQRSTDVLAIMQKARRWDADCLEAERRVEVLAQEIGRVGYVLETGPSTNGALSDNGSRKLSPSAPDLASLSTALDDLFDRSRDPSSDIDLRGSRRARLDRLRGRCDRLSQSIREVPDPQPSSESRNNTAALGAPEADALTQADSAEPALQDSSAAPPTATLALGPENDTALDLFTFDPPSDEPAAFSDLRRHVQRIATADWLSPTLLVLPSTADAASLDGELATCRGELAALAEGSDETLVWADFPSLEREIEDKDKQVRRVAALARFADFLARADATLSDL